MHFFRKLLTRKKFASVLAIGMLLRSIVAVGYMLDTNPENGGLLSIKLCSGPAGINAIAGLEDHSQHHQHHGHHDKGEKHEHATQDHAFSSCSFWSASSQSLLADNFSLDTTKNLLSEEAIIYQSQVIQLHTNYSRYARAPPVLG